MITGIESQDDIRKVFIIFSSIWGDETLSELVISIHTTTCIINKWSGEVVGYLFYKEDERDKAIEVTDFGVDNGLQNKGIGRQLIEHLFTKTDSIKLTVNVKNESANALYSKMGFREINRYENYYGVGSDGLRLVWMKKGD